MGHVWQSADNSDYDYEYDDDTADEFLVGERICEPQGNTRGNVVLRVYTAVGILALGAFALSQPIVSRWMTAAEGVVSPLLSPPAAPPAEQAKAIPPPPVAAPPIKEEAVADAPPIAAEPATTTAPPAPEDTAAQNEDEDTNAAPPAPLPPPKVDPGDRYQARALSVGLNPSLSHTLLQRLSEADYRNASEAIRKALASTSNDEVLVWPERRTAARAQFEVHFVRSASADCRRYVVKIAKDGWATTAAPLEKCGFAAPAARAG